MALCKAHSSLAALALLVACGDTPIVSSPDELLPLTFQVRGSAEGVVGDRTITCTLDFVWERSGSPAQAFGNDLTFPASWGGMAERIFLLPDGSGMSLSPEFFCPNTQCQIRVWARDSVEMLSPADYDASVPFNVGIGRMQGRLTGDGHGKGRWTCRPFLVRGDDVGNIEGSWVIEPME